MTLGGQASKISVSTSVKWKYHLLSHRVVKRFMASSTAPQCTLVLQPCPLHFCIDKYHGSRAPKRWEEFCRDKCFSTRIVGAKQWSQAPESWLSVLFRTSLVSVRKGPIAQERHHPQKGKCIRKNAAAAPASCRASPAYTLLTLPRSAMRKLKKRGMRWPTGLLRKKGHFPLRSKTQIVSLGDTSNLRIFFKAQCELQGVKKHSSSFYKNLN